MQLHDTARTMLDRFALPGQLLEVRPFGDGHINDTFLATTDNGRFILQRISPVAFKRPDQVMENVAQVTAYLHRVIAQDGGDPTRETLTLVPLKEGGVYTFDAEGGCWRVYLMIEDSKSYLLPENEDVLREAGRAFGRFQRQLAEYPAATLHETIPHFHDTPSRVATFRNAVARNASGRLEQAQEEVAFVLDRAGRADWLTSQLAAGVLPLRVTHNDTKLSNVLMDKQTGRGLCAIDLDTVMPGLAAYDFGDSIRSGASTADEDEQDLSKVHFSLSMFRAYAEGFLAETGRMFSPAEINSLAAGAWMMTYECGLRFLADFLDGDVYFHTAYPEHNLVRARTQFALVREMEVQEQDMLRVLHECAGRAD